ncbi:MAG: hemerythrin domain-containing protein [Thiotrichales bacterium]
MTTPPANQTGANGEQLQALSREHRECLAFADKIALIANQGSDDDLLEGIRLIQEYNVNEMEAHLQHEEQTIFAPLVQQHREHLALCVQLGKEHGLLRTLVESTSPDSARQDLAEFARVLRQHTLTEEENLFPLLADLFTAEQLDVVLHFSPLKRQSAPESGAIKPASERSEWLEELELFFNSAGNTGGSIVLLPRYQPELMAAIAARLGLAVFDYRQEVMQPLREAADSPTLAQLEADLRQRATQGGIIGQNVEALLGVKPEAERRTWLQAFLDADWPNPVLLPICVFQADVPPGHVQVCDLELLKLPRQAPGSMAAPAARMKYSL